MADSMDQLEQLQRQTWLEAIGAVDNALAPEWKSAQSDVDREGDLPGRLAAAVAALDPDLRSVAEKLAVLAGRGDLDPAALVEAYLKEPDTRALSALAGHILAKGDEDGGFYEGKLRPMLLAKLPDLTGDKEAPGGEAPTPDEGTTIDTAAPGDEAATREEAPKDDIAAPGDGTATRDEAPPGDTTAHGDEAPRGDEVALGNNVTTGDRPENSIDQQAWLLTLFLVMKKNWGDPPAEWLTSARAYFERRITEFNPEPSKGFTKKRVGRKEQFIRELLPREKALVDSSADLKAHIHEALGAGASEEHSSRSVQTRRLVVGGAAALLLILAVILFATGVIPWPLGAAESTAETPETPETGATAEPTIGGGALETTPTISGVEELTPEPPPTSAPAAAGELAADGPGWLCAAGAEWRQLVTVTNTGEAEATYTIAVLLGDQPGGAVHLPPGSPGDCGLAEPSPDITLERGADAQRLLIFPNVPGGGQSPRAELRPDGADTLLFQAGLPELQTLSITLARPEGALEAYGLRQGEPLVVPFLLQANSPGDYELACAPEGEDAPGEGTTVTVSDIDVPVEATCMVAMEESLEAAVNWQATVFPLSPGRGAEVAQAQDSANGFVVEPPRYDLAVTPRDPLGIIWLDNAGQDNDQVGIGQIYELRNTGNITYWLESLLEFTNGLRGFYGAAPWEADVPLDASFTLVTPVENSESGARIQLRDGGGNVYDLESLPYELLSSTPPSLDNPKGSYNISSNERLILEPCPGPTPDADDPTPECIVKFVIWFRATGMRSIVADQPIEYSVTFRPVPDLANPELVDRDEPVPTLINSGINLEDQPDRVIELLSD